MLDGDAGASTSSAPRGGRFGADPQAIYERWDEFAQWAPGAERRRAVRRGGLGAPVPRPRQVFALGLNYALHAREAGLELPPMPLTFTKFPSCIVGPGRDVVVVADRRSTGRSSSSR